MTRSNRKIDGTPLSDTLYVDPPTADKLSEPVRQHVRTLYVDPPTADKQSEPVRQHVRKVLARLSTRSGRGKLAHG